MTTARILARTLALTGLSLTTLLTAAVPQTALAAEGDVTTYVTIPASIPFGVRFGAGGYLYVSGQQSASTGKVWKVGPGGGPVTEFASGLGEPKGMAFDASGNLYVADWRDRVQPAYIWKITPAGVKSVWVTVAGATFLEMNNAGDLLVGTWGSLKIRRVTPAAVVSDYATGIAGAADEISGLVYDPSTDEVHCGAGPFIKKVGPGGSPITTLANGLVGIYGLARGPLGEFYAARYSHRDVYRIEPAGAVSAYAGVHLGSGCTDGPRLGGARFTLPAGLAVSNSTLFIADTGCQSIRTIELPGVVPAIPSTWGRLKAIYR